MNTEEDTFNKLKRLPLEQVFNNIDTMRFYAVTLLGARRPIPEDLLTRLQAGGWTVDDFLTELKRIIDEDFILEVSVNQPLQYRLKDDGDTDTIDRLDSGDRGDRTTFSHWNLK
jgi:hypothetical protein